MNRNQSLLERIQSVRNGIVDITGTPHPSLPLYEEKDVNNKYFKKEAVSANLETTRLQTAFFSEKNIEVLQKLIAYHVWIQSNKRHRIARQDDNQLKIVMKSIYFTYSKNLDNNIMQQVKELNSYVLDYCVPEVLSNVEQYLSYKKRVSNLPVPLELPKYTAKAGTRTHNELVF
jgi:hypothetical protein